MRIRPFAQSVLVFAGLLAAGSASAETCRYFCGTTIRQGSAAHCCGTPFQCPDGTTAYPYAYNNGVWRICGSSAAALGNCGGDAASLPDWTANEAVPAPAEEAGPSASASGTASATPSS
jgi:hypothetical protein